MNHNSWRIRVLAIVAFTFMLGHVASAQYAETVLYEFGSIANDGNGPISSLIFDASGNLYGNTANGGGGGLGFGTVFELSPSSGGTWTESILYAFAGGSDGDRPSGAVALDASGNVYGVTELGGANNYGIVYKLTHGSSGWTETILHSFAGGSDGAYPLYRVVFDASGNLYGTTQGGGNPECNGGCGVIFKLSPTASGWTESVIYSFTGLADGSRPASLIFDASGNLFGAAIGGGNLTSCSNGCGTIFRLTPVVGGWRFGRLYAFQNAGGANPVSITLDPAGNIYGVTENGGIACSCGVAFKLTKPAVGGLWRESILHAFTGKYDGYLPLGIAIDSSGNLFGNTPSGSTHGYGTIFKIAFVSTGWSFATIHSFTGASDGGSINGAPTPDSSGNIFAPSVFGGFNTFGLILELSPSAGNSK